MSAYTLRGVAQRYGEQIALDVPELDLDRGRAVALVGPNGSGKSTLLQILALLQAPTAGEVTLHGEPVRWRNGGSGAAASRSQRRQATLVMQEPVLFSTTVRANVAFGLAAHAVPRDRITPRVLEALADVGLEGFEGRRARALSGGEAQRVVLARALALRTPVLLLDEPTTYLDAAFRPTLTRLMTGARDRGTTLIFATHDPTLAGEVAHEVITLSRGRIEDREILAG